MKKLFLLVGIFLAVSTTADAFEGNEGGGGGDVCESKIKEVRDDIALWIRNGGPQGLNLPSGVSVSSYSNRMLYAIDAARVSCVSQGDRGYPVEVNGTPKVCRFDRTAISLRITCDFSKFQALQDEDQYRLIHHEFAGLAGIETPNADDSNYAVSNQLSHFLVDRVVTRLAIQPGGRPVSEQTLLECSFRSNSLRIAKLGNVVTLHRENMDHRLGHSEYISGATTSETDAMIEQVAQVSKGGNQIEIVFRDGKRLMIKAELTNGFYEIKFSSDIEHMSTSLTEIFENLTNSFYDSCEL